MLGWMSCREASALCTGRLCRERPSASHRVGMRASKVALCTSGSCHIAVSLHVNPLNVCDDYWGFFFCVSCAAILFMASKVGLLFCLKHKGRRSSSEPLCV